jgi:hypothetical protein
VSGEVLHVVRNLKFSEINVHTCTAIHFKERFYVKEQCHNWHMEANIKIDFNLQDLLEASPSMKFWTSYFMRALTLSVILYWQVDI